MIALLLHSRPMAGRLFGTAGIRGVTNSDITPELAVRVGVVFADHLVLRGRERPVVGVAHDTRHGAEILARAAAAGLASAGASVQFYGCIPTGTLAMNVARNSQDGAILVTGSHLGPDRIGLIPMMGDGTYAPVAVTDDLELRLRTYGARARPVPPERIGVVEESFHPFELYVSELVRQVDARLLRERGFKVLVDPANGPASYVAKELFEWFGCEVEMLHFDPKPVPDRPSECRASSCGIAIDRTAELGCDLGLCTDVDADRALFITKEGIPLAEDAVGAIFATEVLRKGDACVTPVTSSGLIDRVCREIGARVVPCAPGQPAIVQAVRESNAAYACEESGKYYFPRIQPWCDALMAGARMLQLMAETRQSLSGLAAPLPRYHTLRRRVPVAADRVDAVMDRVRTEMATRLVEDAAGDVTIDGLKRHYRDGSWLLIRASGTEPVIRVFADATSAARVETLAAGGVALVKELVA